MRLSRYFLPILSDAPAGVEMPSHRLMLRAGLIRQAAAGIFAWLPLGLRVLERVCAVLKQEQVRAGAIEMLMPTVQPAKLWRESGRYSKYGKELLRVEDRHARKMLFAPTAEEAVTAIARDTIHSYRDLPKILFQIAWKFRDEVKPRHGTLYAREFLMKDAYSFDLDAVGARHSYNRMFVAYLRSFALLGVKAIPMRAGTGPMGGELSHEFIVLADRGASAVFYDCAYLDFAPPPPAVDFDDIVGLQGVVDAWTSHYAATDGMHEEAVFAEVPEDCRAVGRGIEVGHIFSLGTKYSEPMKALVTGPDDEDRPVHMGAYGIGASRLVAAIVEANHDEAGIVWPETVAPFDVALINLTIGHGATDAACERILADLEIGGLSVLYDDRDAPPSQKFATADLIGLPWQVVVGPNGLAEGRIELRSRANGRRETLAPIDLLPRLKRI